MRVDGYPGQEGQLNFNSNDMVWHRRKTKMLKLQRPYSTWCLYKERIHGQLMISCRMSRKSSFYSKSKRIIELVSHGPATEHQFVAQQFHILSSSVETQGIGRRREAVEVEPYVYPQMEERDHGMYYTPPTFSQYPTQMYQYSFKGHQSDMSASSSTLGGVAKTYANFSWPAMTPSQQHDASIPTPNAPLGTQWNVPGTIPDMSDLLGVDLRHQFSVEADQVEAGRHQGRRNPGKQP
ncbi:hypothetical protein HKD37_13G036680 [Glycine soja]